MNEKYLRVIRYLLANNMWHEAFYLDKTCWVEVRNNDFLKIPNGLTLDTTCIFNADIERNTTQIRFK